MTAQRQRVRRVALAREPRQEVRRPSTRRRCSRRGRTAAAACAPLPLARAGRRERTSRSELDGEHCVRAADSARRAASPGRAAGRRLRVLRCARHACPHRQGRHSARSDGVRRVRPRLPPLRAPCHVPRRGARASIPATSAGRCRRSARADAPLVIVGLAPGMHGANASGRPFTGDYAGILLYETLHAYGFASQPGRDGARRRPRAHRLPHHQRGQVPAAGEQAGAGRGAHVQRLSRRRSRHGARGRRDPRARPHRARRDAARARRKRLGASRSRTARGIALAARRRALRQLSLQPLQHEYADGSRRRCSAPCSTTIAAHLGRGAARAPRPPRHRVRRRQRPAASRRRRRSTRAS